MTRVRCILVETTVPVRIRPRIETWPVKGHFLSVIPILVFSTPGRRVFWIAQNYQVWQKVFHTNVGALDCGLRGPEAQSNIFVPSSPTLSNSCAFSSLCLLVDENMRLLLESALRLHRQFSRHVCWLVVMSMKTLNICVGAKSCRFFA